MKKILIYVFLISFCFGGQIFNPDISFILDNSYVGRSVEDEIFEELEIPGLYHPHHNFHAHSHGLNKNNGFNFNYGELYLYSPVDPYFDLHVVIPFSEEGLEIEEGYIVTRGLPFNLQFKMGKFRSSFGRLNVQHLHFWDFSNLPLVYKVFLGDDGLVEKGVNINWVLPFPFYLSLGLEVLQGENEQSFGIKGFSAESISVEDAKVPNLSVGFLKNSFDIGNLSILTGLSFATGKSRISHLLEEELHAFAGKTKIFGFDFTAKYFINSYRYLSFQGEFILRNQKGKEYEYDGNQLYENSVSKVQGGFYSQLVLRFTRRWRTGFQYNLINKNDVKVNDIRKDFPQHFLSYYAMLEFNPTEFSRIRLEVGQNRTFYHEGKKKTINEVILEFNFAIGAHGAHPF